MSNDDKIPLPKFSGKKKDYPVFVKKFKAYALGKKFAEAIQEAPEPNLPAKQSETNGDADKEAAVERNKTAISKLTLAFETQELIAMVEDTESVDWPNGLAWKVMQELSADYAPQGMMAELNIDKELNKLSMNITESPRKLFKKITLIKSKAKSTGVASAVTDDKLRVKIVQAAPMEYQSVLASKIEEKPNATVKDLRNAMDRLWAQMQNKITKEMRNDDDNLSPTNLEQHEMVLSFTGKCFNCGKIGHRMNDCTEPRSELNKCSFCGKMGHNERYCWEKEENADKRPDWWKNRDNRQSTSGAGPRVETMLTMLAWCGEVQECGEESKLWVDVAKTDAVETIKKDEATEADQYATNCGYEMALMTKKIASNIRVEIDESGRIEDPDIWIADSGATVHSTGFPVGLKNVKKLTNAHVIGATGKTAMAMERGDLCGTVVSRDGKVVMNATMTDVEYVPFSNFSLFSLTRMMRKGWNLQGDGKNGLTLWKGKQRLVFDIEIKTTEGSVWAMKFVRAHPESRELTLACTAAGVNMDIEQAHALLGHSGFVNTQATAEALEWNIRDKNKAQEKVCVPCTVAKAKQKNVCKANNEHVKDKGRAFLDTKTIKSRKGHPKQTFPNWTMLVKEITGFKWSSFHKKKNDMVPVMCERMHRLKENGYPIKFLRMDNAGENVALDQSMNGVQWRLNITTEWCPTRTPQMNYWPEVGFHVVFGRAMAMMNHAHVPKKVRPRIWNLPEKPKYLNLA